MMSELTRRVFLLSSVATGALLTASPSNALQVVRGQRATENRSPLAPQPFYQLPAGSIRPAGWLRRQLLIQARGMGGRLDETWPDVGPDSGWLGGTGESWERGPYFVDGLLPLAWQLDDPALKAKAQRFIEWTLSSQRADGMFGPQSNDDWWPRMVMLKVLTQYHELAGDGRVIPFMTRYFHHQLEALPSRPLKDWGRFRWQDEVVSVLWLYNRTGDPRLLQLATLLKQQGFDWQGLFVDYPYREKTTKASVGMDRPDVPGEVPQGLKDPALSVHGVNNAQALKASPIWSLVSRRPEDRSAVQRQLDQLDRYHGLPIGIFSADEHLAGRSANQGVELCTIVEAMFSLEVSLAITGDAAIGDRLERIAYNALPATFTDDMWAHQYDQQPNQVQCSEGAGPWTTNGPESNLFGLAPHFGCCTANFHQGWPKLTASLWMASADSGLAATVYGPCEVATEVRGVPVTLRETTDYPFRNDISIEIEPKSAVRFPLHLRIPGWAAGATILVNGTKHPATAGGFARFDRTWSRGDRIELRLPSAPRASRGFARSIYFEDGPLLFSLPITERWTKLRQRGLTADWEVTPGSEWAFAVSPDASPVREQLPIGEMPFSRRNPPALLHVQAMPVSGWDMRDGAADPVPAAPRDFGPKQQITLMPYGVPKLRLTEFAVGNG